MSDDSFTEFVLDQLGDLDDVHCRPMFGARGLYRGSVFFAIVSRGRLYFKTDRESASEYRARGMKPFRPAPGQVLKTYYEVPADILEDRTLTTAWARRAVAAQTEGPGSRSPGPHPKRPRAKGK